MKELIVCKNSENIGLSSHDKIEYEEKIENLEEQLKARDTEISILVDMIKSNNNQEKPLLPNISNKTYGQSVKVNETVQNLKSLKVPGYFGDGGFLVDKEKIESKEMAFEIFKSMYPSTSVLK